MDNTIGILVCGAGGFAREVAWLAHDVLAAQALGPTAARRVLGYVDLRSGPDVHGVAVVTMEESFRRFPGAGYVVAIASAERRQKVDREITDGGGVIETLVHPHNRIGPRVDIGAGAMICGGVTLTTDIRIGRHVIINLHCTVGHDVVIEDFVNICPGVHVSGNVHIGEGAFIGTGAVISNGTADKPIRIGAHAKVGAGAVVIADVPPGATVVGVPAKARQHATV